MLSHSQGDGAHARDDVAGHALWLRATTDAAPVVPTVVRLTSSDPRAPQGSPVSLTARVVSIGPDDDAATGRVTFRVDGTRVGESALDPAGRAVLSGVRMEAGVHAVVAAYSGDARHAAASSTPLPQAVVVAATPVVVLVATPAVGERSVCLEAEVVDPGTGRLAEAASGDVVFLVGERELGVAPLRGGQARLTVGAVPAGELRARYTGDREHGAAQGVLP